MTAASATPPEHGVASAPRDHVVVGAACGRWQTNCYVIADRAAETAVVIDPGEDAARWVAATMSSLSVTCTAVLLTHGHVDHLWSVPEVAAAHDVPVFLHPEDRWLWDRPLGGLGVPDGAAERFMGGAWEPPTDRLEDLRDGQRLQVGGIGLVAAHSPGHTPGHVAFLSHDLAGAEVTIERALPAPPGGTLFSGDLLFRGSVGRTDFPRGSWETQLDSLVRVVLPLEDEVVVLSGHGPDTTVGTERATNPFLSGLPPEARRATRGV